MGILERIKEIETEMARTQKNKATNYHLGTLKAKIAKLRTQLLEPAVGSGGGPKAGFEVQKHGDGRIAIIGFPSVGKSTLLNKLCGTESECAAYEFTTLTCVPGMVEYNDAKIQLLDLPGIIEGAAHGRGRGRQVIATAKSADLIFIVLDATKVRFLFVFFYFFHIVFRNLSCFFFLCPSCMAIWRSSMRKREPT